MSDLWVATVWLTQALEIVERRIFLITYPSCLHVSILLSAYFDFILDVVDTEAEDVSDVD